MINKLIIIVLFLYNINLLAQESLLKGVIVDSESKIPISGANISILNSSIGTISNSEGKFLLNIPKDYNDEIMIFSFMGYKSLRFDINSFKNDSIILLNPSTIVLDEIILSASKISLAANEIIQKAFDNYDKNFPTKPYLAKGFLRHVEKNKKEYKWLVESAITLYDNSEKHNDAIIKINVDEIRKSYDHRSLDSLLLYLKYLIGVRNMGYKVFNKKVREKIRDTVSILELTKAIKYNDNKTNGLKKIFNGHKNIVKNRNNFDNGNQNLLRNYGSIGAMFDENIFKKHHFSLDTLLLDGDRYVYKVKITPHPKMIDLNTVLKKQYAPIGWIYIYKDNYAIKELEYALIAVSKGAKLRNRLIFGSPFHYKVNLKYYDYNGKMYLKYFSCNVPKTINFLAPLNANGEYDKENIRKKNDRYYYTKQEILFTEIMTDTKVINTSLTESWDDDFFKMRTYHSEFWKNYNVLLESEEQQQLIQDLEGKVKLRDQFKESN